MNALLNLFKKKSIVTVACVSILEETPEYLQKIVHLADYGKVVFIPIYTRSHWVASVLRIRSDGTPTLVYYDLAPSHQVRRDIDLVFLKKLNIEVKEQSIQRQERDSVDCGLYMFAVYEGIFFRSPIKDLKSKIRRLRDFLS
ncbi:hypothetical protein ADEAN_000279800 [Angomonas deanei]|uniref:Ubiquitin-like protease family profile domain-containing protein n=1 Tax=Angomonas deanei TaxID=59799 RepID=A0A7G2C9A0_9TRYP|nr:hypothetical protein ADEAN_000279800 [Angomonas deanei]